MRHDLGAVLAAGAEAFQRFGSGPEAEAKSIEAAQSLVQVFQDQNKSINCGDITDIDDSSSPMELLTKYLLKGQSNRCFCMSVKYAPNAFEEINAVFARNDTDSPSMPVSCTAELARRWGLSGLQVAMAAGLAGGIGLSGDACGALGAAI